MEPAIGAQLGNYRLVRVIGTGGFAHVYLGQHIYLDTEAAIKVLDVGFDLANADIERFLREARMIARLRHPSIVSVLEFGIEKDLPYLVMEYAAHGSLRARHPKGTVLPLSTVASYVQQVAAALQYAHEHSVIHCDVKPENMLIGEDEKILLGDFGIARVVQNTIQTTRDVVGTVYYMAPEQFAGKAIPATDQYAFAVVVYQWLSGQLPFEGNNIAEIFFMHTRMEPLSLLSLVPAIPSAVQSVVFKALEKDPQQRFPDMASFAAAFAEAVQTIQLPTGGGVAAFPAVPQTFTAPAAPDNRTWYTLAPVDAAPEVIENLLPPLSLYLPLAQNQNVDENAGPDIEEDISTMIVPPWPSQPEPTVKVPPQLQQQEPFILVPPLLTADSAATLLLPTFVDFLTPTKDVPEEPPATPSQTVPEPQPEPKQGLPPLSLIDAASASLLLPTFIDFLPRTPVAIEDISTEIDPPQPQSQEPAPVPPSKPAPLPPQPPQLEPKPKIEIFISYSHFDIKYRERLDRSLASLRRAYPAVIWNDGEIRAGMDFRQEIVKHLEQAQIILLLVSDNFLASEYCNEEELKPAMKRHHVGDAHVIPVILNQCLWRIAPFGKLQALPRQGKAITGWNPRSAGYANVAEGIEKVITYILNSAKH